GFWHSLLQNGNYSFLIARKNDVFNRVFRDSAFEHFDYFVRVEQITVLVVAVISGLNPATHVRAFCGDVLQTVTIDRAGRGEYENLRSISISKHNRIPPIMINQPRKWIKMGLVIYKKPVTLKRSVEQTDLEVVVCGGTSKDSQALSGHRYTALQLTHYPHEILFKAFSFRRLRRITHAPACQLFTRDAQQL